MDKALNKTQQQQFLDYLKELYAHNRAYHDSKEMMAWLLTAANIGFSGVIAASVVQNGAPPCFAGRAYLSAPICIC